MDGRWTPGIGDPSPMGWVTVACYLLAALACADAARRTTNPRRFWWALAGVLLALGINKQLDLQSLLTQVARDAAKAQGWYESRRTVQMLFVLLTAAAGLILIVSVMLHARTWKSTQRLALGGTMMIFLFVVIRASSFHHVDYLINHSVLSMKMNWLLEIGGIILILVPALVDGGRLITARR